jgi:hypothetical protein
MPRRRAISHGQAQRSAQPAAAWTWSWRASPTGRRGKSPGSSVQCNAPVANGIDLCLLECVTPIEWDNVVLYGQYILTGSSSAGAAPKKVRS